MKVLRNVAAVSAAIALSVGSANAQMITFATTGAFTGTGCSATGGVALVSTWCEAAGGVRLTYNFGANSGLHHRRRGRHPGGLDMGADSPANFVIIGVCYTLSQDLLTSGVRIDPPGVDGIASDPQTIRGFVSAVPEPSTYLLRASGLAALGVMAHRRRTV